MKCAFGMLLTLVVLVTIGCEGNISTAPPIEGVAASGPAPPAPAPAGGKDTAASGEEPAEGEAPAEDPAAAAAETPAAPAGETTKAEVGVGTKGKDYGGEGFVTTPIQAYFRTGERIAFEIQIPNAMKLYKAEHDNKGPKTHEEFMNIIVKENGVQLPDLAAGEEYIYDPGSEELLVKHPVK